jgi:hypothetical protein
VPHAGELGTLVAVEAVLDFAEEPDEDRLAELSDGSDDHQRNAGGNQAVLDRRGGTDVPREPS